MGKRTSLAHTPPHTPSRASRASSSAPVREPEGDGRGGTAGEQTSEQEARRQARLQRQMAAQVAALRRKRLAALRRIAVVAALVIVAAGSLATWYASEASKPGEGVTTQPSPHIQSVTDPHSPYDSNPPTSGPHVPQTAPWGVSATPVPDEVAVHNLEDGGVVISYRPDLAKETVSRLQDLTRTYDRDVLMTARPGLPEPVALTAWGRIERLGSVDEALIKRFIEAYRGKDHHRDSGS